MTRRKKGKAVHGWLVLDKPAGMTSTQAVGAVRRPFDARKAGHAGTLDPLATGILPIALGEATKTVPYAVEGQKDYEFTVRWGAETDTDDAEGRIVATSEARPAREAIEALLPSFTGEILQTPPAFSAVKIDGERAYDLARAGEAVELEARPVHIEALALATARTATRRSSPPAAARAPTCAPLRATWAGRSAASAMSSHCGAPASAASARRTRSRMEALRAAADDGGGGAASACCGPSRRRSPTLPPSGSAATMPRACCGASRSSSAGTDLLARGRPMPPARATSWRWA